MSETQKEFSEQVKNLAKPGEDILRTLNPNRAHLLHMALGLSGEYGELCDIIAESYINNFFDRNHLREELGDFEFYLEGIRQGANLNPARSHVPVPTAKYNNEYVFHSLGACVGEVVDIIKKFTIYNKAELDVDKLQLAVDGVTSRLYSFMNIFFFDRKDILNQNLDKLSRGKNARYTDGYSDKQAHDRRDKAEERERQTY